MADAFDREIRKKAMDVLLKLIFFVMGVLFNFFFFVMGVLFKFIGRHVGYLACCKRYVQNLEDEAEALDKVKQMIEGMVDEARRNVEVIDGGVERWLKEVREKQEEVRKLLEDKKGLRCLSIGLRYRLGREGCKKKEDVIGLKRDGDGFVNKGSVGRPATPTANLDVYTDNYGRFASRETVFKAIMEALQDDGTYIIGIHGMPGIGKTRMAVEVAKQAKERGLFEEIANSTISQTPDWKKTQQELADRLGLRFDTGMSRAGRADRLCQRLQNGEKILVILDDVWNQFNLKMEIGIPFGNWTKGCKILLTSRRQDVCSQMRADKTLQLGVLGEDEAWSLFKTKVGESVESAKEMRSLAKEVCKECGGLPLAILAVGGALMDKGKPEWNDAFRQLRNSTGNRIDGIEAQVYNPINLSYHYLEQPDAQSCFLHCSLFPEDAHISVDDLVWYGVGRRFLPSFDKIQEARDRVHVLVGNLKRSSLLLPGRDETLVQMHDVIRDVAISIASRDKKYAFLVKNGARGWPDKDKYECCMAISLRLNSTHELPDGLKCPKLRMLVMAFTMVTLHGPFLKVPNNFFKGMKKLEVLDLRGLHVLILTSSLQNLVNLRMLRLTNCKLENLSIFNGLHKIEILCLRHCIIEKSPRPSTDSIEPSMEARKLFCLKILDLGLDRGLDVLPEGFISNLSCLEELYIYKFDKWKIKGNASPIELNSLTCLSTLEIHIPNMTLLPKDFCFKLLNRFKVSLGSRFENSEYNYDKSILRALKLDGIPLMVELNTLIEKAQALSFIEVNGLEKVLYDRDFSKLEYLNVHRFNGMEHLLGKAKQNSRTSSVSLSKLRVLRVLGCSVKYLFPASIGKGLQQLQELCVENCERMEGIIGGSDNEESVHSIIFNGLKKLKLKDLPKFKSICADMKQGSSTECSTSTGNTTVPLFNAKVLFPALEELEIKGLDNMTVICEEQLVPMGMEASHAQLCSFIKMRVLRVDRNCRLKYLFSPSVAALFRQQLQELRVKNCESLQTIIGEDVEKVTGPIIFHQLKYLQLECLPILKNVSANTGKMLSQSTNAPPLFDAKVWFPSLEKMVINGLDLITVIWDEQLLSILTETSQDQLCSFRKLSDLTVSKNCKLKYLFSLSIARCLRRLRFLKVENCESMETIIGDEEEVMDSITFHKLKRLTLYNLPNLKSIYANTKKMSSSECNLSTTLTALLNAKISFPILAVLSIKRLHSITSFGVVISNKKLQELIVISCEKLEELISIESGDKGEEFVDDKILPLTKLREIILHNLPHLQRLFFSCGSEVKEKNERDDHHSHAALFNKVSFPVLRRLDIYGLKCIMLINQLHSVKNKLRDSFPQLWSLHVRNCENMEMIVVVEMEARGREAIENDIVLFPQLTNMTLEDLPNLKSFWGTCASKDEEIVEEALFKLNRSVKIPHVERLFIKGVDKLKEIWHSTVTCDSVSKLTKLTVQDCANLLNVGPLKLLGSVVHSLEELKIIKCPSLQDVFKIEASKVSVEDERFEKEEGVTVDAESSVVFCKLRSLGLSSLDSVPPFARGKDSFPKLYELSMSEGSMLEETREGRVPFVGKVRVLNLEECSQLVNDVPWVDLLQRFGAVEELNITSCSSLQVVFNLQGLDDDAIERLAAVSSQVKRLTLKDLPELEHMRMEYYPKEPVVFSNLTWLTIECCNKLKYLFSISTANALTQLQSLFIKKCDGLEEIVVIEGGQEDIAAEEIVFPQLRKLRFTSLMKLTSFCGANNIAFKFPSLHYVEIWKCSKLYTFTCGATETPMITVLTVIDGLRATVSDMNEYVQLSARKMRGR